VVVDTVKCCVCCVIDVLHAVNDGSLSWMQRVKLLRYAWVSDDVMLVNKKQTLMNVLISALSVTRRCLLTVVFLIYFCVQSGF